MCRTYASLKRSKYHNVTPEVKLWKFETAPISRGGDCNTGVLPGYSVKFQIAWLWSSDVSQLQANA